ncbi:MAG: (2Fe-2S) ferredoxin domain-containing protein [Lachnospirales bacterium]
MEIFVCVGSSCHLKGSKTVIDKLTELINANNLEGKAVLKGSFCMGQCSHQGVSVKINNEVYSVTEEDVEMFFNKKICLMFNY